VVKEREEGELDSDGASGRSWPERKKSPGFWGEVEIDRVPDAKRKNHVRPLVMGGGAPAGGGIFCYCVFKEKKGEGEKRGRVTEKGKKGEGKEGKKIINACL